MLKTNIRLTFYNAIFEKVKKQSCSGSFFLQTIFQLACFLYGLFSHQPENIFDLSSGFLKKNVFLVTIFCKKYGGLKIINLVHLGQSMPISFVLLTRKRIFNPSKKTFQIELRHSNWAFLFLFLQHTNYIVCI